MYLEVNETIGEGRSVGEKTHNPKKQLHRTMMSTTTEAGNYRKEDEGVLRHDDDQNLTYTSFK